jgi:CBS domain-containing protein
MRTVRDLLKAKGNAAWSTSSNSTVYEALRLMAEKNIGAVLVVESEKLVGIFSERDYARKVTLKGKLAGHTLVRDVMSSDVITVNMDQSVEECMELMTNKHIRHLPVFIGAKLEGVVSIGDVVKSIIEEQKTTIDHLEKYISGR